MDPIVFLLGTGGPKTAQVHTPIFAGLFVFFRLFYTDNDVLLIQAYGRKRF